MNFNKLQRGTQFNVRKVGVDEDTILGHTSHSLAPNPTFIPPSLQSGGYLRRLGHYRFDLKSGEIGFLTPRKKWDGLFFTSNNIPPPFQAAISGGGGISDPNARKWGEFDHSRHECAYSYSENPPTFWPNPPPPPPPPSPRYYLYPEYPWVLESKVISILNVY